MYLFFVKPRYELLDIKDNKYRTSVELRKKNEDEWVKYKDRELVQSGVLDYITKIYMSGAVFYYTYDVIWHY